VKIRRVSASYDGREDDRDDDTEGDNDYNDDDVTPVISFPSTFSTFSTIRARHPTAACTLHTLILLLRSIKLKCAHHGSEDSCHQGVQTRTSTS
jgi:hypothetical protein